ncbi:MAG: acyl-homoserine-lactone synthase [Christensenellales bacterium]
MSTYNKFIRNDEVVPVIFNDLFKGADNKRFATIMFGFGSQPKGINHSLFLGYLSLRKNVYVNQTGILDASEEFASGTESDKDDSRSAHIAVFENRGSGKVAVIGCLRLIIKQDKRPLPIEEFYPEVFGRKPIAAGNVEMSRFISRAEKGKGDNYHIIMSLFGISLNYALQNGVSFAYGVIETKLWHAMQSFSTVSKKIGELKMIEEYNTENIGIEMNINDAHIDLEKKGFTYMEIEPNKPYFW